MRKYIIAGCISFVVIILTVLTALAVAVIRCGEQMEGW